MVVLTQFQIQIPLWSWPLAFGAFGAGNPSPHITIPWVWEGGVGVRGVAPAPEHLDHTLWVRGVGMELGPENLTMP